MSDLIGIVFAFAIFGLIATFFGGALLLATTALWPISALSAFFSTIVGAIFSSYLLAQTQSS